MIFKNAPKITVAVFIIILSIFLWVSFYVLGDEISFVYLGEISPTEAVDNFYFNTQGSRPIISNIPTDVIVIRNSEKLKVICDQLGLEFPYNVDFTQEQVIFTYGRRLERLDWVSCGINTNFPIHHTQYKALIITFSEDYYANTAFFYVISDGTYYFSLPLSNISGYGPFYILLKSGERIEIRNGEDLNNEKLIQEIIGNGN